MKALVIGGGGREHALCWKLKKSPSVEHVWCAPGNDGIAQDAECLPASVGDIPGILALAQKLRPDITVVGPEEPLVLGLSDELTRNGFRVIGPSRAAAQLEGSKVFSKRFMERNAIPTARIYGIYDDLGKAESALETVPLPVVIKADGPCAGKGVLVTGSLLEAQHFVRRLMSQKEFGAAGGTVLLEEALEGVELSFIVLSDSQNFMPMVPARDHKRVFDGDQGPNTGGMGAYSADGMLSTDIQAVILEKVVRPTLAGIAREGSPFVGFLYSGLMLTPKGPKVLEYNCRMGDPECQAIVARMDFDLGEALQAAAEGHLRGFSARWNPAASVCVVLTSGGYPGAYQKGKRISGLREAEKSGDVVVFHSGTKAADGNFVTAGGRVLGVTAAAGDLSSAGARAYAAAGRIRFDDMHYRKDIASK
jgi:phosphoribosylamine--glycine ligase